VGRGRLLVPLDGFEEVAHVLLVEARLAVSLLVEVRRPEARGVWCQRFVYEDKLAVKNAELELGVRDDDATFEGVFCGLTSYATKAKCL